MTARPRSTWATLAAALMGLSTAITAITGLPPLGASDPPLRRFMAWLLAANMLWIAWGTLRIEATAWLCAMLLYGAIGAFSAATLVVGPRPPIAWVHAALCVGIMGCLAHPAVREAFRRAQAIRAVPQKR